MAEVDLASLQRMVRRILDGRLDLREDVRETKHRLVTLEQPVAGLVASEAGHDASLASRLDRLERRVERIERRLDRVEPVTGRRGTVRIGPEPGSGGLQSTP